MTLHRSTTLQQGLKTLAALLCAAVLCAGAADAQIWPTRSIRLIVSTGPGLATDIMARLMADGLSRQLGQQVYVENVPGAAGMIGAAAAARAAPDGYTFFFGPASALSSNMYLYKSVPYDPSRDFTPVAMVCDSAPFALSVQAQLPIATLPELVAHARGKPGTLSYAVDTSSGYAVVIGQLLGKRGGIDWVQVPYKSTPQMLQDTSAGVTQLMISSVGAVAGMVTAGKLRMVALSSERRFPGLDHVPTIAETFPGFRIEGWFAVVAPVGTPAPIVDRLNREIDMFLKSPDLPPRLTTLGLATSGAGTPRSTAEFLRAEQERWKSLVAELDIQPQ
jgi:tripartite-type tricarboxylate transporter receptor subunit TctC